MTTPAAPRHVLNALNKAGVKVGDLTDEQHARALAADTQKAGLRGKALAAWIIDGAGIGEQVATAHATAHAAATAEAKAAKQNGHPTQARVHREGSGPDRMRDVLQVAGRPLHVKVIAELVLASGGDTVYGGKTPAQTMSAQLTTSSNRGGVFVRVAPGCFGLREWPAETLALEPLRTVRVETEAAAA